MRFTKSTGFPLVLGPNLGCPEIVSVEEVRDGKTIPLIIAGEYCKSASPTAEVFRSAFHLRPSDGAKEKVALHVVGEPKEIVDWNQLSEFRDLGATREVMSSELHYKVLGPGTTYWRVEVAIRDSYDILLRTNDEAVRPRLWDLVLAADGKELERVNRHAVQFARSLETGCKFVHLTDLHLAKRNDEILDEVLKAGVAKGPKKPQVAYINFGAKFREFIRIANGMADKGELDFVVITGDLVDFAYHGWSNDANEAENNWRVFVNVVTGDGKEELRGNPGLKVAMFTSTGNHDWRLHPYDPKLQWESFGLTREELKGFEYRSPDSKKYLADKRRRLVTEFTVGANKWLKKAQWWRKLGMWFVKLPYSRIVKRVMAVVGLGSLGTGGLGRFFGDHVRLYILAGVLALFLVLLVVLHVVLKLSLRKVIDLYVENPLDAEPRALHYYLRHVNPYLDYAFTFGRHSFVVMDTGSDVFVGELLDGKKAGALKQMSLQDNILGGSPDSRAFDSEQAYHSWSQIVWLEKVLSCVRRQARDPGSRTFVLLHAPPINCRNGGRCAWPSLWERNRKKPKWIAKDECSLTFGTINHYLSQFFYLCMGHRECDMAAGRTAPAVPRVDLVLSGHAHRNIEFRVDHHRGPPDKIRIYSDVYSELVDKDNPDAWWNDHKPVIVQTAACGLEGETDKRPPYFRNIVIDEEGRISDFRVKNSAGYVKFGP